MLAEHVRSRVGELVTSLEFWSVDAGDSCSGSDLVDIDAPSYRPLYERIKKEIEGQAGKSEDDDEEWNQLMAKRRKLERKASRETDAETEPGTKADAEPEASGAAKDLEAWVLKLKVTLTPDSWFERFEYVI